MFIDNTNIARDDIGKISWKKTIESSSFNNTGEEVSEMAYISDNDNRIINSVNKSYQYNTIRLKSDSFINKAKNYTDGYISDKNATNILIHEKPEDVFLETTSKRLTALLRVGDVETGVSSIAEIYVRKLLDETKYLTLTMIDKVYLDNNDNSDIKIGLLHLSSHLEYDIAYPILQTMALGALNDKNDDVKDYAVQCFENWNNKDAIRLLEQVETNANWLREYIENVINTLKDSV